ncbi:hypothetical protein B0H14DRAFT_2582688 [Mycena olivaceomarginata]|nr:hypothetical protein B0H14DRAFT_2582688 [Mycena olivaceomarginata]
MHGGPPCSQTIEQRLYEHGVRQIRLFKDLRLIDLLVLPIHKVDVRDLVVDVPKAMAVTKNVRKADTCNEVDELAMCCTERVTNSTLAFDSDKPHSFRHHAHKICSVIWEKTPDGLAAKLESRCSYRRVYLCEGSQKACGLWCANRFKLVHWKASANIKPSSNQSGSYTRIWVPIHFKLIPGVVRDARGLGSNVVLAGKMWEVVVKKLEIESERRKMRMARVENKIRTHHAGSGIKDDVQGGSRFHRGGTSISSSKS